MPRIVEVEQHERVGEGQREHGQHPLEVQYQGESREPLLVKDIVHSVSVDNEDSEPLLDVDREPGGQHHHQHVVDGPDGQDGEHIRADGGPEGLHQHQHVVDVQD